MVKKKMVLKKEEEITDIICNKCEKSCKKQINHVGLLEVTAYGGYDSDHIGDENSWTFSLCEECLFELTKTFKIPQQEDEHILGLKITK